MTKAILLAWCSLSVAALAGAEAPWGRIAVGDHQDPVGMAVVDLQRYLAQVSGLVPTVATPGSTGAAVVLSLDPSATRLGDQGYVLEQRGESVYVGAATPIGLVNGIYGLLRELGFRFYLGSESIPKTLPEQLSAPLIERKPALRVRGVLPWYNFFNSPTAWDSVDHRTFVDQLIRSGANFVGFHSYDGEPFAGYFENGDVKWGSRLLNTATPTWGTAPLKTSEFAFGTSQLFADDYFGAETTLAKNGNADAVRAEQAVMRGALDYAHRRGLTTCIGFEMDGNATNPEMRDAFIKRLNHVLDAYPMLDVIWLWQSEAQGVQPAALGADSPVLSYGMARRGLFKRVVDEVKGEGGFHQDNEAGKLARATEGARLEQFAQLALRAFRQRTHAPRLAISGWGGDERLLSADYYEGLDALLPPDVVFTSLDHISPRQRIDAVYHKLSPTRERWPIPWMENDGDQWRPQPFVHLYETMMRDVMKSGSQGVLGIHWRTRDIEENFGYLTDTAWNPALSADAFFADIAAHGFPPALTGDMGRILSELDRAGYSWVGGSGQSECAPFTWGVPDPKTRATFEALRARVGELAEGDHGQSPRLIWLRNVADWVSAYADVQESVAQATALLAQARSAAGTERVSLARQALAALDGGDFPKALWSFVRRVSTRGEYGVLATINTKAVVAWRALRADAAALAGVDAAESPMPALNPAIVMPRLTGTVPEGLDLELRVIVISGGAAWLHYRVLGESAWHTAPLELLRGWVYRGTVPGTRVKTPGIEMGCSFLADSASPMAWGPVAVTAQTLTENGMQMAGQKTAEAVAGPLNINAQASQEALVEVRWTDVPDADYFRVYRNGQVAVETATPFFPDCPTQTKNLYRVEALRGGKVIAASAPVDFDLTGVTVRAPDAVDMVRAGLNRKGVLLYWEGRVSPFTARYRIERRAEGGEWQPCAEPRLSAGRRNIHLDTPGPGLWAYRVTPIGPTGLTGPSAQTQVNFTPREGDPKPVADWPLNAAPEGAAVSGGVQFSPDGAVFTGGRIVMPDSPAHDLNDAMALHFEFRAGQVTEMPVLLGHGVWQQDGWFVQILGGRLMVRMKDGDAEGPVIEPGKWYSIDFAFDGAYVHLAVNGQWIKQRGGPIQSVPARRPLILGGYELDSSQYRFQGTLRNVRIFQDIAVDLPSQ